MLVSVLMGLVASPVNVLAATTSGAENIVVNVGWSDNNNKPLKRPKTVTVDLMANGKVIKSQVLHGTGGKGGVWASVWTYEFSKLPTAQNGKKIDYIVKEEVNPTGYTMS